MYLAKALILSLLTLYVGWSQAAEQVTYYHNNMVGSPVAATDDTGTLLWEQAYDPWGVRMLPSSEARGFTGADVDPETALVDMQARWYSPGIGRMLALDPPGFREDSIHSFNLYAYGNNNPYRYVDPNGEIPIETIWDAANVAMGLASFGYNVSQGNYGSAAVDLGGAIVDGVATIIPYVPGGAGTAIKASRGLEAAAKDASKYGGRSGKQARLREMMNDPKASSADRGWLKNDARHIEYGNKSGLRIPRNGRKSPGRKAEDKGYELAHPHDAPASQGNSYGGSKLKHHADHKVETRLHRRRY